MKKTRSKLSRLMLVCALVAFLPACAQTQLASHYAKKAFGQYKPQGSYKVGNPYKIAGKLYTPEETFNHVETGVASWYGPGFHGKLTANGEKYDQYALTAAHRTLQMPSLVRVTNLENGKSVVVRVNDRGPFKDGRVIDMSSRGADLLGFKKQGIAKVRIEVLENESRQMAAAAKAGKDTTRYDVASLNRRAQTRSRAPSQAQPVRQQRAVAPEPAVLMNDAQMVSLPESLQPAVRTEDAILVSSDPLDLKVAPVESAVLTEPRYQQAQSAPRPVANASRDEMDFLKDLDFMQNSRISGHEEDGRFMPDPVVKQGRPEQGSLYVQAGSFSSFGNAEKLASQLASVGVVNINEALVNGQQFYRVRIGPMDDVDQADLVLAEVANSGQQTARIIVD